MKRVPEPELMLDAEQARAYAEADFAEPHDHFVALMQDRLPGLLTSGRALDLGCGAGDISRRFARALPGWRVHGVDGSPAMLDLAVSMTAACGLADRVSFAEVLLPTPAPADDFDLLFSNSLLHHMASPDAFWSTLRDWSGPGGCVFVMDLLRPASAAQASRLVERYAAGEPLVLREDFYNSLCAAYEVGEVEAQLEAAGLGTLMIETVSDRHLIAWGRVPGG